MLHFDMDMSFIAIQSPIFERFLSDPSPIIGYACHSLTDSRTDCRLVNLIDVTLACEDGNSKLVEVAFDLEAEVWS